MTIYFIYKNDKIQYPTLYAITDNSELKKSFIKERKQSLFIIKEKNMTKEEFKEICKYHNKYLLGIRGFETKPNEDSLLKRDHIFITATAYEEINVFLKMDTVVSDISRYTHGYGKAFNDEIIKALNSLHYFEILKFKYNNQHYEDYFIDGINEFDVYSYRIDSFSVFMYLYGETLDLKGCIRNGISNQ